MFRRFLTYFKVWLLVASDAAQVVFINRLSSLFFLIGKALRLGISLLVLLLIRSTTHAFGPYTTDQMVVFFLTYVLIDTIAQIFFRGVYSFTNLIRSGELDLLLVKPISPLFLALAGSPDINDAIFLIPTLIVVGLVFFQLHITVTLFSAVLYGLLLINSFLIVTALHIVIVATGLFTTEVDGVVWLYRDLSRFGQFPISVYNQVVRITLFFIIPIGFMITIPTQVLLGIAPSYPLILSFVVGIISLWGSYQFWLSALRQYNSASS